MTVEDITSHFDLYAGTPDGVAKIRELVLGLAFTGALSGVRGAESRLPVGWQRTSIAQLCELIEPGFACSKSHQVENGYVHLRTHNISTRGVLNFDLMIRIDPERIDILKASIRKGDILFNNTNSQELVGKTAVADRDYDYGFSNHITRLRVKDSTWAPFVAYYLTYLRNSGYFARICTRWIGQAGINTKLLKSQEVLLPPLIEQKRLVAKIDELMALCNKLEVQQAEREMKHAHLARAALASFGEAPTPENLNYLFHKAHDVSLADMRGLILTLAVQGRLAPQDARDGSAHELLRELKGERARFAQATGFRSTEATKELASPAKRRLPQNWSMCRLAELFNAITDGDHQAPPQSDSGVAFLTIGNVTSGVLNFEKCRFVPHSYYEALASFRQPTRGDILYTVVGATYGRPAFVDTDRLFCVQRHIAILKPSSMLSPEFLMILLKSPDTYAQASSNITGTAQPTLPLTALRNFEVPLPPLAEQRRIAATVERLMMLVDQWEAQLKRSRRTGERLMEAVLADLAGYAAVNERASTGNERIRPMTRTKAITPRLTTSAVTLKGLELKTNYRSLAPFKRAFHPICPPATGANPICLVGLNGSGKSNLIEALAEIFCFLELINLPWWKLKSKTSRYRENRHRFVLDYQLTDESGEHHIRIRKLHNTGAKFFEVLSDGSEKEVEHGESQLALLPRRIIGYSSGLNETVSHPFQRTKTIYSEEVRDAAPPEDDEERSDDWVADTRTLYMDYESNSAIIIANYIFQKSEHLQVFKEFTRVDSVASFTLQFNRKMAGKSAHNNIVRLTAELRSYLRKFAICANQELDEEALSHTFKFILNEDTRALLQAEFGDAETFFMAMYKWSLLNSLILSDDQRKVYLSNDITKGALERPPSVPPSDRVFDIQNLKLRISEPNKEIDYSGLSDGEHQFMQVFGTVLLFNAPGSLFLFDEPESHFNPEWRTKFNLILDRLPHADRQEFVISTHSPYLVSGAHQWDVFKFVRQGGVVSFDQVKFDTYGAPFDQLLKNLFSINTTIDESAREQLQAIISRNQDAELRSAVDDFAESKEKRRLYEAIIRKEGGE